MLLLSNASSNIQLINSCLAKGKIICFPTETVYSVSCDASFPSAIKRICEIKHRKADAPFSVLMSGIDQMKKYVSINDYALRLIEKLSPGPITYILPALPKNKLAVISSDNTIGVRIPDHPVAMFILKKYGFPLVGTSVNLSGENPATCMEEIFPRFAEIDLAVKDEKNSVSGTSSTVIDLTRNGRYTIIREGKISQKQIEAVLYPK